MKKTQSGFTLIELLVVIAIIGILASIVLVSLGSARVKATDAKVQAQMSSMRAQAELFYSGAGDYGTATAATDCSAGEIFLTGTNTLYNLLQAIPTGYTPVCHTDPTSGQASAWAVFIPGSTSQWCVDSTGQFKAYPGAPVGTVTNAVCPAS